MLHKYRPHKVLHPIWQVCEVTEGSSNTVWMLTSMGQQVTLWTVPKSARSVVSHFLAAIGEWERMNWRKLVPEPLHGVLAAWTQGQHWEQRSCAAWIQRAVWGGAVGSLSRGHSLVLRSCIKSERLPLSLSGVHCAHAGTQPHSSLIWTCPLASPAFTLHLP